MASSARPLHTLRPASVRFLSSTPTTATTTSCLCSRQRIPGLYYTTRGSLRSLSSTTTASSLIRTKSATTTQPSSSRRSISTTPTPPLRAKVVPLYGTGPPPEPPLPAAEFSSPSSSSSKDNNAPTSSQPPKSDLENLSTTAAATMARRRRQAEMLKLARDIRTASASNKDGLLKRRFWKDVTVRLVDDTTDGSGNPPHYQVFLDGRPLRRPDTKAVIRVPASKPHLAAALALEWDHLVSSRDATRNHLIPLTGLICRALDIAEDDVVHAAKGEVGQIRSSIATTLLRYLDTDSLLCWAPPVDPNDPASPSSALDDEGKSLRERQEEAAGRVVAVLTGQVWPGVSIVPVLDGESLMPRKQAEGTREVVQGWLLNPAQLSAWELAGLERATLASKSLLVGARLVVEWSEEGAGLGMIAAAEKGGEETFGVEEAARVASIEVDWQIGRWGEVEDTHDVEKEDVRRQLGSVVLLVSGEGQSQEPLKANI